MDFDVATGGQYRVQLNQAPCSGSGVFVVQRRPRAFHTSTERSLFVSATNGTGSVIAGTANSAEVPQLSTDQYASSLEFGTGPRFENRPFLGHAKAAQAATKKVAIVGRAPSSMALAPFGNPEWEIWSLSNAAACGQVKDEHWHAWFEVHDLEAGWKRWPAEYKAWLQKDHGKPLYIQKPHPLIPHGIVYPWEQVFSEFGSYFNNSVSEMIAVALLEGATDLALYGVDMAQSDPALHEGNGEYQHQRPSCEFMLGIALARLGKEHVYVPPESDLLKCTRVYAYPGAEGEHCRKARARKKELQERRLQVVMAEKQHRDQEREWRVIAARHDGVIQQAKQSPNVNPTELAAVQKQHDDAMNQHRLHKMNAEEAMKGVAKLEGALEDNDYWIQNLQA
jgi:hypothetical protein